LSFFCREYSDENAKMDATFERRKAEKLLIRTANVE
jgi:hypothetical protein